MATVLLVDDDPDNRNLIAAWLRLMGHRVLGAASALEALHLLGEHGVPDVVVVDIVMDPINGLDLLDHVRRFHPSGAQVPAVLMTARHLHTDRADAGALHATLLTKPMERASLAAAIERVLEPVGS